MEKDYLLDKCIVCKDTDLDFIPVCDEHEHTKDQTTIMNCDGCKTCCDCSPREYWED